MKRYLMLLAVPLLAMGCANEEPASPKSVYVPAPTQVKTPAPTTVSVAAPKPAPAPKAYFETKKDGTMYVFGSFASMKAFNQGGTGLQWIKKDGPNGEPVAMESGSDQLSDSLWGEYVKSHPKKVAP